MDQNKNQGQGQQNPDQHPSREPSEGKPDMPGRDQGNQGTQRRPERGMDRDLEEEDLTDSGIADQSDR